MSVSFTERRRPTEIPTTASSADEDISLFPRLKSVRVPTKGAGLFLALYNGAVRVTEGSEVERNSDEVMRAEKYE